MTLTVLKGGLAPAVRSSCAAADPFIIHTSETATDLVGLFGLDRLPARPQLVCRWHRDRDGRLACLWEPDIVAIPQR